jgi:hypothetical protein
VGCALAAANYLLPVAAWKMVRVVSFTVGRSLCLVPFFSMGTPQTSNKQSFSSIVDRCFVGSSVPSEFWVSFFPSVHCDSRSRRKSPRASLRFGSRHFESTVSPSTADRHPILSVFVSRCLGSTLGVRCFCFVLINSCTRTLLPQNPSTHSDTDYQALAHNLHTDHHTLTTLLLTLFTFLSIIIDIIFMQGSVLGRSGLL